MPASASSDIWTCAARSQRRSGTKSRVKGLPPDLILVDYLVDRWARWVREGGLVFGTTKSIFQRIIEWHELGLSPEKLYPHAGTDKSPDGVELIERIIIRLPQQFRRIIITEYLGPGPQEANARSCHLNRLDYRVGLRCALWTIYGQITGCE